MVTAHTGVPNFRGTHYKHPTRKSKLLHTNMLVNQWKKKRTGYYIHAYLSINRKKLLAHGQDMTCIIQIN